MYNCEMAVFCLKALMVIRDFFSRAFLAVFGAPFIGMFIRKRALSLTLPKKEFGSILDIGCGDGSHSFFLSKKFPRASIIAIDRSKESIDYCKQKQKEQNAKKIDFLQTDLFSFNQKRKFDLVVMFEVLHYLDKEKSLEKIFSLLKEGGTLAVSVPLDNWFSGTLLKKLASARALQKFADFTEQQLLSQKALEKLLEKNNFSIVLGKKMLGFFGSLAWETEFIVVHSKIQRFYYIFYPFLKAIAFLDAFFENKKGRAIVFLAKKRMGK